MRSASLFDREKAEQATRKNLVIAGCAIAGEYSFFSRKIPCSKIIFYAEVLDHKQYNL